MVLKLKDGRKELYQWDVGVVADVTDKNINEVHFSNLRYGVPFNIKVKNGTVTIPPEVLQSGAGVFCWAFVRRENGGYTKKEQVFNVEKRPRPADYVYTPTDVLTWEALKKQIEEVEKGTIKVLTSGEVKLWELESGLYRVTADTTVNASITETLPGPVASYSYLYVGGALYSGQANKYIIGWAFLASPRYDYRWAAKIFTGATYTDGIAKETASELATVTKLNKLEERLNTKLKDVATKNYVNESINALQGNLDEVSALVGGA